MKIKLSIYCFLTTFNLFAQGITGYIEINAGATTTNNPQKKVNLTLGASNASQMQISNDGSFIGVKWEKFSHYKPNWVLRGKDGLKTVYAKFRGSDFNISEVVSAFIELDRIPPIDPDIIINAGRTHTRNKERNVFLELFCKEAVKMRISLRSDFLGSSWVNYGPRVKKFRIPGRDGKRLIYAQFRDLAGNLTRPVSSSIILDTQGPDRVAIEVNEGRRYTTSNKVSIRLYARGAKEMQIRGGTGWMPYRERLEWELPAGDGEKIILARFRDEAGNVTKPVHDRVIVDTQPPSSVKIQINDGATYINHFSDVHIALWAVGASEMLVGTSPGFERAGWRPYNALVSSFPIEDTEGKKKIYVKFRDRAGNESKVVLDSVFFDKTPRLRGKYAWYRKMPFIAKN